MRFLNPKRLRRIRLTRVWRWFFLALAAVAFGGMALVWWSEHYSGLYLFTLYAMPSNSLIPFPHEPGLLYFAKYYHPGWIAVAGTIGTGVAACADYGVVEAAFRHPKIGSARDARVFKAAVRWLLRFPFLTCALFSFLPLPINVVRVLAPASGYPPLRYVISMMVGRLPRFYVVAWIGHMIHIPTWILVLLFAGPLAAFLLSNRLKRRRTRSGPADQTGASDDHFVVPDLSDPDHPRHSREMRVVDDNGQPL